jgi:hypothetical protein
MTLVISKGITLRNQLPADADADAYIAAVEAADSQTLESGVKFAIKNFVLCCKQDGIWDAIKASCILAGARTRLGALVPLKGTAPTSLNFVNADYNRKTGLAGNGSTKYLNSNRNNNADPQNSKHMATYVSTAEAGNGVYIGAGRFSTGDSGFGSDNSNRRLFSRLNCATADFVNDAQAATGLVGMTRLSSSAYTLRALGQNNTFMQASETPSNNLAFVFARTGTGGAAAELHSSARLAFYSIGESLDLALLDARVTDLINAFAAAIP